jgi:hypothetical protein
VAGVDLMGMARRWRRRGRHGAVGYNGGRRSPWAANRWRWAHADGGGRQRRRRLPRGVGAPSFLTDTAASGAGRATRKTSRWAPVPTFSAAGGGWGWGGGAAAMRRQRARRPSDPGILSSPWRPCRKCLNLESFRGCSGICVLTSAVSEAAARSERWSRRACDWPRAAACGAVRPGG